MYFYQHRDSFPCSPKLRNEQTAVAITQEAEVVCKGVIVHLAPVAANERTYQEQQRGLRLVEVGYEHSHYLVRKAGGYDDLRACMECLQAVAI